MASSFQRRRLDVTFQLAAGSFDGGGDTVKLTGLRMGAEIHMAGGYQLSEGKFRIYGLGQELMNRLTVLAWQALTFKRNTIRIEAGSGDGEDMHTVFFGDIYNAWADYQGAPDVPFIVDAKTGFVDKIRATKPRSFPGTQPVARIMSQLAGMLGPNGSTLENNGVTTTVTDMYLTGSPMDQVMQLKKAADIDVYYEPPTLAICPRGKARKKQKVILNAQSGLVGWPTIDRIGVAATSLYNPAIVYGGEITIESSMEKANGDWFVYSMTHSLSSETPSGPWFTHILASEQQNAIRK